MICILVHIIPQVYYYSGERGREHFEGAQTDEYLMRLVRPCRVPILIPILVGLVIEGAAALSTAGSGKPEFPVFLSPD